jgi:asparagine synthase (glutamine-hydrolysing)
VDSSVVLAVAAHVARREGLPAPVPITSRFPDLEETDEAQWQERVIDHLGLDDWLRLEWEDELDVLGPIATTVLRRHGLLFPWNSFFHYPILERAAGGSVLTGIGGDHIFKLVGRWFAARLLYARRRPRKGEGRRLVYELSPRPLRYAIDRRDTFVDLFQWIRTSQRRAIRHALADWFSRAPLRNDRALREWWWPSRTLQCGTASLGALAGDFGTLIAHPLTDPGLLRALAQTGGAAGIGGGSRGRGVKFLVGDLLPRETLDRQTKTTFDGAYWSGPARAFVNRWDGSGLNPDHVDIDALRREWSKERPFPQSYIQLQRAWLSSG